MSKIKSIFILVFSVAIIGCSANGDKIGSKKPLSLIEEADRYYTLGLLTDAEAKYRKVLQENPTYYEAWLKLGNIFIRTDQLDAAIIAYRACSKNMPEDVRCWNNLALARLKQAMVTLETGKRNVSESPDDFYTLDRLQMKIIGVISTNK